MSFYGTTASRALPVRAPFLSLWSALRGLARGRSKAAGGGARSTQANSTLADRGVRSTLQCAASFFLSRPCEKKILQKCNVRGPRGAALPRRFTELGETFEVRSDGQPKAAVLHGHLCELRPASPRAFPFWESFPHCFFIFLVFDFSFLSN